MYHNLLRTLTENYISGKAISKEYITKILFQVIIENSPAIHDNDNEVVFYDMKYHEHDNYYKNHILFPLIEMIVEERALINLWMEPISVLQKILTTYINIVDWAKLQDLDFVDYLVDQKILKFRKQLTDELLSCSTESPMHALIPDFRILTNFTVVIYDILKHIGLKKRELI